MDDHLLRAYRDTDYRVDVDAGFSIRIGTRCAALDVILSAHGMSEAAFLTAWNPYSKATSEIDNAAAQAHLAAHLTAAGYEFLQGEGVGQGGDWPPEPSLLILGISRQAATEISKSYGQNAYVYVRIGEAAELILNHS